MLFGSACGGASVKGEVSILARPFAPIRAGARQCNKAEIPYSQSFNGLLSRSFPVKLAIEQAAPYVLCFYLLLLLGTLPVQATPFVLSVVWRRQS